MTKLNTLITKESGMREALQQGTVLMESDFIQALKASVHTICHHSQRSQGVETSARSLDLFFFYVSGVS